jgi:hypothetical protein
MNSGDGVGGALLRGFDMRKFRGHYPNYSIHWRSEGVGE